ncbi:MAG: hypothetical protein WC895_04150 [Candidatus Shapirobacteria bacterium]|jgi:hypothetical protein
MGGQGSGRKPGSKKGMKTIGRDFYYDVKNRKPIKAFMKKIKKLKEK